jgi:DNA-binding transcriptional regulator YiaG
MTPVEMQESREALGMSRDDLSIVLGVQRQAVTRWERGARAIPKTVSNIMGWLDAGFKPEKYEVKK